MLKRIFLIVIGFIVLVVFSLVFLIKFFEDDYSSLKIQGRSMQPTYQPEEGITCKKYRQEELKRGVIVVFNHTREDKGKKYYAEYVKRIIAVPQDEIIFKEGNVMLNKKLLNENYSTYPTNLWEGGFAKEGEKIKIPLNSYFVMGDNRIHSSDSREFGFVKKSDITCYINPISNDKKLKIKSIEKKLETDNISIITENYLRSYKYRIDKEVDINEVLEENFKVKMGKYLIENKYKDVLSKEDLTNVIDRLNRQIIYSQIFINKWVVDRPLNEINDFQIWEIIVKLNNETRQILNLYSFER